MRVFDLQCQHHHVFEGWFGSEDDYQQQKQRGLLQCPICNSHEVNKRLSAPRINLGKNQSHGHDKSGDALPASAVSGAIPSGKASKALPHALAADGVPMPSQQDLMALQAAYLDFARKVIANTEDVGDNFADEARSMHYGDSPERPIRGHASEQEKAALREEGIEIHELLLPKAADETLQ